MPKAQLTGLAAALRSLDSVGVRGSPSMLARKLGVTRAAICNWKYGIPLDRVMEVERATGVPRHVLRPDYWQAVERLTGLTRTQISKAMEQRAA